MLADGLVCFVCQAGFSQFLFLALELLCLVLSCWLARMASRRLFLFAGAPGRVGEGVGWIGWIQPCHKNQASGRGDLGSLRWLRHPKGTPVGKNRLFCRFAFSAGSSGNNEFFGLRDKKVQQGYLAKETATSKLSISTSQIL